MRNKALMSNKTMRQTTSFRLNRSASMEVPPPLQPVPAVPKKSHVIEFPTSPQLTLGGEIRHFSHPQHPLSQVNLPDLFTCVGCRDSGAGMKFTCQQCDFQLHEFCALAPPVLKGHPFHSQHQLVLYSKPVKGTGGSKSKCDVCGKPIKGFGFRCSACSFQMHPCCAMLSTEMNFACHSHTLRLLPSNEISTGDPGFVCGECKRKRSGRVYHCTVCDYHLHAVCAKNMVNGLNAYGIKDPAKPSMLGTAARLASQVVVVFLEGLVEGLAEGVGEVFAQNIARSGRGNNRIRNE